LKFFPLNTIKIDGVYTREFNEKDDAIIIALNQLAHQLGLETIAEGVETENQFDRLTRLGCDMAQGIYLGRAASFETTLKLLDQWNK
jgi:EAL domain-containing protein (putative c-di-GMP-specific phosphodiesterase class I)